VDFVETKQIHLNVNILSSGSHSASWRAAGGNPLGHIMIEHYQAIAQEAERGLFDAVFLADALTLEFDPRTNPSWALDPAQIVVGMAAVTTQRLYRQRVDDIQPSLQPCPLILVARPHHPWPCRLEHRDNL
jgi:hypothetical protein